jgi:hypothetical protein
MSLDLIHVNPHTFLQVERSGQPVVVYECKLHQQGVSCGLCMEGTTSAVSAHLREHGIPSSDDSNTSCTWGTCSKTLKRGSLTRHILAHLGVKVRCSACGVVKCRHDLLRKHIRSSEPCSFASVDTVDGPDGRIVIPTRWSTQRMGVRDPHPSCDCIVLIKIGCIYRNSQIRTITPMRGRTALNRDGWLPRS